MGWNLLGADWGWCDGRRHRQCMWRQKGSPRLLTLHPGQPSTLVFMAVMVEIIPQRRADVPLGLLSPQCSEPSVQEEALNCQAQPGSHFCPAKSSHPSKPKLNSSCPRKSVITTLTPPHPQCSLHKLTVAEVSECSLCARHCVKPLTYFYHLGTTFGINAIIF